MSVELHLSKEQLEAALPQIRLSPKDNGTLQMIVRRPKIEAREVIEQGELDTVVGLVGDCWSTRPGFKTPDGLPNPDQQVTLMNSRAIALIAQTTDRWPLAGDQLYVDLDLSDENAPAGTKLCIGTAILQVTAEPHNGCRKFSNRFGTAATKFVNSQEGKFLHLRGINARVIQNGAIRVGDVLKVQRPS